VKSASAETLAVPGRYQAHVSGAGHSGLMLKTHIRRVAAGAMISAALTVGSLGLTATTASARACPDANCVKGVPPAAAVSLHCSDPSCLSGTRPAAASALECSEPKCLSGTRPAAVPRPVAAVIAINCPPPNPQVKARISDC